MKELKSCLTNVDLYCSFYSSGQFYRREKQRRLSWSHIFIAQNSLGKIQIWRRLVTPGNVCFIYYAVLLRYIIAVEDNHLNQWNNHRLFEINTCEIYKFCNQVREYSYNWKRISFGCRVDDVRTRLRISLLMWTSKMI